MQLVSVVSDAVLNITVPDEEAISIQTSGMSFNLGRHTPAKLAGLKIESSGGKFALPAENDSLVSRITNTSFVDTQVIIFCVVVVNKIFIFTKSKQAKQVTKRLERPLNKFVEGRISCKLF